MNDTRDLTKRLAELLSREHAALADFLVALADFDRERRWVELGYRRPPHEQDLGRHAHGSRHFGILGNTVSGPAACSRAPARRAVYAAVDEPLRPRAAQRAQARDRP